MISTQQIISEMQSSEEIINHLDFIDLAKDLAKKHLEQIADDTNNASIVTLIKDFYNTNESNSENYQVIEEKCTQLLLKALAKARRPHNTLTGRLKPLLGALFFMIGTCQLAEGQDIKAGISFEEAYYHIDNDKSLEFESIITLASMYTLLKKPTPEKFIKTSSQLPLLATLKNTIKENTEENIKINDNAALDKLFAYFYNNCISTVKNEKALSALNILFDMWDEEDDEKEIKRLTDDILSSQSFRYLDVDDIYCFYTRLIAHQIKEVAELKEKKRPVSAEQYKDITSKIIEACAHLQLPDLIAHILEEIDAINENTDDLYRDIRECKNVLAQLRNDHVQYCTISSNEEIDYLLTSMASFSTREPFNKFTISNKKFVTESNKLANPILAELCTSVSQNKVKDCKQFINRLNQLSANMLVPPPKSKKNNKANKTPIVKENPFQKLYDDCLNYIAELHKEGSCLHIGKKHGPILEILYYVACLSQIGMHDNLENIALDEMILNEGLYYASLTNSPLKDLYYLLRSYMRLNDSLCESDAKIHGARADLQKISNKFTNIKSKKTNDNLITIIINDLNKYTERYPATNLNKDPRIDQLLKEIKECILKGDYQNLDKMEDDFYDYDQKLIHPHQKVDFDFLMSILYFKLRNEVMDDKEHKHKTNSYDGALLRHLQKVLENTSDLIATFLEFKEMVSTIYPDNKNHVRAFYNFTQLIFDPNDNSKPLYKSVLLKKIVDDYCGESESKVQNKENRANAASLPDKIKPIESSTESKKNKSHPKRLNRTEKREAIENKNKEAEEKRQAKEKREREALAEQLAKEQRLRDEENKKFLEEKRVKDALAKKIADEKKAKEDFEKQLAKEKKEKEDLAKQLANEMRIKEQQEKQLAIEQEEKRLAKEKRLQEKAERRLARERLSKAYLKLFFNDEFSLLDNLQHLAEEHSSSVVFKGSFVVKWKVFYKENIKNDGTNLSNKININDIDAYIECNFANYAEFIKALHLNGFKLTKSDNNTYYNFEKKLKSGYNFEITLKVNDYVNNKPLDFIKVTRGEIRLDKQNVLLPHKIDKDFELVCKKRKVNLGKPTKGMTSCAYRLYKCEKRYKGIIEITNLNEIKEDLINLFYLELAENKYKKAPNERAEAVYLELRDFKTHDFKTHNVLDDKDAIPYLKLCFTAILKIKGINPSEEMFNAFILFFVSLKDFLNNEDKVSFKKQVNHIVSFYFDKHNPNYNNFLIKEIMRLRTVGCQMRTTSSQGALNKFGTFSTYERTASYSNDIRSGMNKSL